MALCRRQTHSLIQNIQAVFHKKSNIQKYNPTLDTLIIIVLWKEFECFIDFSVYTYM